MPQEQEQRQRWHIKKAYSMSEGTFSWPVDEEVDEQRYITITVV